MGKLFIILFLVSAFPCHAQDSLPHCIFGKMKTIQGLNTYPLSKNNSAVNSAVDVGQVFIVPVVVHVIYNGGPENISDAIVQSEIPVLNEDYGHYGRGYNTSPLGEDAKIKFALATIDPNGKPTTGIEHIKSPYTNLNSDSEMLTKNLSVWPTSRYLNIWVVKSLDKTISGGEEVGYAYLSSDVKNLQDPNADGIVVNYQFFGRNSPYNPGNYKYGRTCTHETGHYFNLLHPWGLDGPGYDGCTDGGDDVDDTPPCDGPYFSTYRGAIPDSCDDPVQCTDNLRLIADYMDYSVDRCMDIFTKGQITRMRQAILTDRPALVSYENMIATGLQNLYLQYNQPVADAIDISPNPSGGAFYLFPDFKFQISFPKPIAPFNRSAFMPKFVALMKRVSLTNKTVLFMLLIFLSALQDLAAQNKYWVSFTLKTTKNFNPYKFFDPKTIQNRILAGKPISDWYDLPVDTEFIKGVTKIADSTGYASRWLNGMAVFATQKELKLIGSLSYVEDIEQMGIIGTPASLSDRKKEVSDETDSVKRSKVAEQFDGLEGNEMVAHGLSGKGIRIAILDVGFKNADKHPAFEYLRNHNGIVMTYDFLHHKENVYNYGAHGTAVLSCIAGKYKGFNMGLAPDAEFLLARTEREATEFKDEEDAWVAAAEWAEQHGAQMISCSLGYTYQRYFYKDMNGRTSVAARGAAEAARKGILICIAAGNEGEDQWKFITTPGDCDSVLTVGGYDPQTGFHTGFSSYGPTADGRMKPNVMAAGTAWVATPVSYGYESGTSFATPLVAGFTACVWQYLRRKTNMQILDTVEKLGSLYPYFDYANGYGIPKAGYLFGKRPVNDSAFSLYLEDGKVMVSISTGYFKDSAQTEKKLANNYLYAKVIDPEGKIKLYDVIKVSSQRFELANITNYLAEGRFGPKASLDEKSPEDLYPKGWRVTVYFDHCIHTYHF